jgi:competence protein ComEA
VLTAWPPSAQLTTVFLLGVTLALVAVQVRGSWRWGSRPSELHPGVLAVPRTDLNRAERAELLQLPGVGNSLAERIETYRREQGPFRSVDDLVAVQGVGPSTLERLRPLVYVVEISGERKERESPTKRAKSGRSSWKSAPSDTDSDERKPLSKKGASPVSPIDINQATVAELQRLPGIGPKMSQRIVEEREKRPFRSVDELRRVSGIGVKTLERLRPFVTVGSSPVRVAAADES